MVECQGLDKACRKTHFSNYQPKSDSVINKEYLKFLKTIAHEDLDKYDLMRFAFVAGVKFGQNNPNLQ
jgi:hypothetical protein